MKYNEIKLSADFTHFIYDGKILFAKTFLNVLKFHSEGFAAVYDGTGWYHIDLEGNELTSKRYTRSFGFYFGRAAVVENNQWFHLNVKGEQVYSNRFAWCGNYQEGVCAVRDFEDNYFHIDRNGNPIYEEKYAYVGDFKDDFACARLQNGLFKHIDIRGKFINCMEFRDLGVFHKGIATAKDEKGWFHCDKSGNALYSRRFGKVEVFYNGFALVEELEGKKCVINESGETILVL